MADTNLTENERPKSPALGAQDAVATATVTIVRAGTGKVETYDLRFTPMPADPASETKGA